MESTRQKTLKLLKATLAISIALAVILLLCPAYAEQIKIATWYIRQLRDSNNEGPVPRVQIDYDRLAKYAILLDADIVALQEVEGPAAAARRIFDPARYNFFFSSRNDEMLTGFAVKSNLNVVQNPDNSDLNVTGGLRHGTEVTLIVNDKSIRLLSIHLKSGCWDDPMNSNKRECVKFSKQLVKA